MIPAEIVERIIKKVLEIKEAKYSDLDRFQERLRMFVGAKFTKWVNEEDRSGLFYVLKKTTVDYRYDDEDDIELFIKCDLDIYDDAHIYVSSCQCDIPNMDLYIKSHKESVILMEEEDIIVSCERLWMH